MQRRWMLRRQREMRMPRRGLLGYAPLSRDGGPFPGVTQKQPCRKSTPIFRFPMRHGDSPAPPRPRAFLPEFLRGAAGKRTKGEARGKACRSKKRKDKKKIKNLRR